MEKRSKQIIVMRKDLNMRKGKMVAQGAHASMKAVLDMGNFKRESKLNFVLEIEEESAVMNWLEGKFTKICVSVDSEEELMAVYEQAKNVGLPVGLITDSGLTEFNGVPTLTCCAIGPAWAEDIDKVTNNLKLL
jgi:PTH2 family peptidyl-tRNA hydrolase